MRGRIASNSKSLQKRLSGFYKELFSVCPVVVSAPGSFWWTGEYVVIEGSFSLSQKIPLRCFVGLEPTSSKEIQIGSLYEFDPEENTFEEYVQDSSISSKIISLLSESDKSQSGFKIHIMSEIPLACGMNSSGALSAALAIAYFLHIGKITPEIIASWKTKKVIDLISDKKTGFDMVFRMAWKFESVFHGDISSGSTAFASLVDSGYPTLFFGPKISREDVIRSRYWQERYKYTNTESYSGARLNELFELPDLPNWPIDFGLVFSGNTRNTASIVRNISDRKAEFKELEKNIKELASKHPASVAKHLLPELSKTNDGDNNFFSIYFDEAKVVSLEILMDFNNLFLKGASHHVLEAFFTSLKKNHDLLKFLIPTSSSVENICRELSRYNAGYKITGGGSKGDVLFAAQDHQIRTEFGEIEKRISERTTKTINLDYASWLDGIEDESILVEQDLNSKIYSEFISNGAVQVTSISPDLSLSSQVFSKEKFMELKDDMDILLDEADSKIYMKGQEITSSEILSSKTTIKVLKTLIDQHGKEVKAKDFGRGSYFDERNEFQSKILTPLSKTCKKRLGKTLEITLNGGLDEFNVKLLPSSLHIHILERTF